MSASIYTLPDSILNRTIEVEMTLNGETLFVELKCKFTYSPAYPGSSFQPHEGATCSLLSAVVLSPKGQEMFDLVHVMNGAWMQIIEETLLEEIRGE